MVAGPEERRRPTPADSDFVHAVGSQPVRQFPHFPGVALSATTLDQILETVR